ncbi:DHA2 family efflux MFS transporter permease subunit [Chloroflexota bacterium]
MENAGRSISYKWIAMSVVAMGTFMSTLDMGAVRVALPHLEQVFQTGPDTVIWVSLIWLLIGSGLMLALGRVGDTFGRKRLYTLGLAIFSLGLVLCSLAQNLIQLVVFRLIQASGAAMTIAIGNAILTTSFPSNERGKALGIIGAVVGLGQLCGPALGGLFLDLLGWRSIFYLRLPIGIISVAMAWALLKEQSSPKRMEKFDLLGAATFFFALTCLLLAITRGQSLGWFSPWVLSLGVAGALLLFFFLVVEQRAEQPVLDLRFFRSRFFSTASSSHVFLYMSTAVASFLMPFYLFQGLGFNTTKTGLLLVTIPAITLVVSPLSGRLSDKLGTRFLCALGLTLVSVGLFLLSGLGTSASIGNIVLYLAILGAGMGLFTAPNTSAIMGSVPSDRLGSASAMVGTLRQLGMSVGLAIASSVFAASQFSHAAQLTSEKLPQDITERLSTISGFQDAAFVALVIAVIGLLVSVLRGKT